MSTKKSKRHKPIEWEVGYLNDVIRKSVSFLLLTSPVLDVQSSQQITRPDTETHIKEMEEDAQLQTHLGI